VEAVELSEFDAVELSDAKAAANSTAAVKKRPAIAIEDGSVRQLLRPTINKGTRRFEVSYLPSVKDSSTLTML
jgi:hypothetical protein